MLNLTVNVMHLHIHNYSSEELVSRVVFGEGRVCLTTCSLHACSSGSRLYRSVPTYTLDMAVLDSNMLFSP